MNKEAVCLFLRRNGKYLAVECTKKTGIPNDLGLPGGKVEPGEDLKRALIREVYEETGLFVSTEPILVYGASQGEYMVYTYAADATGEARSSDEGEVRWVSKEELLASHCTYREYNAKVFEQALRFASSAE